VPALLAVVTALASGAQLPSRIPVEIGRAEAQQLARLELAKPQYTAEQDSIIQRAISWILDRVGDLLNAASGASPLGWFGIVGAGLLMVLAVIAVRRRTGPLSRGAGTPLFDGRDRRAADHRSEAERLAAAGAWAEAVRERLRAVVRDLEERGVVEAAPGRTADEIARDAGQALPSVAGDLRSAARVFDDIWYGGRTADAAAYQRLVAVDDAVRAARPGQGGGTGTDLPMAVPR
jgi:hypothetical protein